LGGFGANDGSLQLAAAKEVSASAFLTISGRWDYGAMGAQIVVVFALIYALFHLGAIWQSSATSKTRDPLAFTLIAAGLYTFFLPLVTISPAVLARTEWSAWNMTAAIYRGSLPVANALWSTYSEIAMAYLSLLLAFIVLVMFASRKALIVIATLGTLATSWAIEMGDSLFGVLFSSSRLLRVEVQYAPAMYGLPVILSALLLVAAAEN
jgi:hypothetical protein